MQQEFSAGNVNALYRQGAMLQQAGNEEQAATVYEAVLELDPWHVGSLMQAAALNMTLGREPAASRCYQDLFNLPDEDIVGAPELEQAPLAGPLAVAELAAQVDRMPLALALLEILARSAPDNADVAVALSRGLLKAGRVADALGRLEGITSAQPDHCEAWALQGLALSEAGDVVGARRALDRALAIDPAYHPARKQLIDLLTQRGLVRQMLEQYRLLVVHVDDDPQLLGDAGIELLLRDRFADANAAFSKMLDIAPDSCLAGLGLGAALIGQEQRDVAQSIIDYALKRTPNDATAILAIVRVFKDHLPPRVLEPLVDAAAQLAWDDSELLRDIIATSYSQRFDRVTLKSLKRMHVLRPDDTSVLPVLIDAKLSACDWGGGETLAREVLDAVDERMAAGRPLDIDVWNLFAIGVDYPILARAARYKSAQIDAELAPRREACGFVPRPSQDERLRIGYIVPYTIKSSHIDNLLTVVRRHDRSRFSLHGYSIAPETNESYESLFKDCFESFRHVRLDRLEESARHIYEDRLDILIDSTGHFSASGMRLAAMRPAPLVLHGAAGFNIVGAAPFYDYSLNDRKFLTEDLTGLYLEQPFYMPHSAMPAELLPVSETPIDRVSCGLPDDAFVFTDFNHPCKFDPRVFSAWMEILRRTPGSVLVLGQWISGASDRLQAMAREQGVDSARVIFSSFMARPQHLRRLQLCDLALDTFYHCGGVTTVDCLIAGLPILTAVPDRILPLANRSLLAAMQLDDMVMPDLESYIERAIALAHAPEELASIRARMTQAREQAPLFQPERWVRNLERSLEIMHRRCLDGDDPAPFSVLDVQDWPN